MKYYSQCPNCGEAAHVAGCVSDKCILEGLKNELRTAEAYLAALKRRISEVEARMQAKTLQGECATHDH